MRVADFLAEQQVAFETIMHPPAYTAQKRAKYLHLPGQQVAKSVLLVGPRGFFLAVLPATLQVDVEALGRHFRGTVRLATDAEVADVFRDCEWGVVAPFGTLYGVPTVVDETLAPDAFLVFEANSHVEAIRLRSRDFERLEKPQRLAFSRL